MATGDTTTTHKHADELRRGDIILVPASSSPDGPWRARVVHVDDCSDPAAVAVRLQWTSGPMEGHTSDRKMYRGERYEMAS